MEGSGLTPAPPPDPWGPSDPWGMPRSALHLAEYWPRVGAAVIDFFVRLGILLAFGGVGALLYLVSIEAGQIGLISGAITGYMLSLFVYAPLMMARTDGQTVGHRVTDTRIVMADGSRMSGGRAFVREVLVKNILIEGVGGFTFYVLTIVNYLFPLWDDNNETLHDKMCSTRVVMVGPSPPA
jgi:uncharacterized RDD family membrane protein YckC